MARMFVDCRDYPSEMNCTVAISADTKEELVDAAVQHAVAVHGHHDSPQLRQELAKMSKPSRATLTMHASFVSGAQRSMSAARRSASSSGAVHRASH
jgi:predicted small metal-binding protein